MTLTVIQRAIILLALVRERQSWRPILESFGPHLAIAVRQELANYEAIQSLIGEADGAEIGGGPLI